MNIADKKSRKILLALDISSQNLAAGKFALSLAEGLKAELIGLFVEDEDLLVSAQYPFSREITVGSALERRLEYSDMERSLRAWFTQMQQQLLHQANQANIKYSFRTYRGRKTETLMEQTESSALLIFSGLRTSRYRAQSDSHAIYVLVDDNSNLDHSLKIAKQLITDGASQLVFIDCGEQQSRENIETAIASFSNTGSNILIKKSKQHPIKDLALMMKSLPATVVLVPSSHQTCQQMTAFKDLQNCLSCPVAVIN